MVNGPGAAVSVSGVMDRSPSSTSMALSADTGVAVTPFCDRSVSYAAVAITPTPKATTTRNPAIGPKSISLLRSLIKFAPFHFLIGKIQCLLPLPHFTGRAPRPVGPKVINHRGQTRPGRGTPARQKGAALCDPLCKRAGTERLRHVPASCAPTVPVLLGGIRSGGAAGSLCREPEALRESLRRWR